MLIKKHDKLLPPFRGKELTDFIFNTGAQHQSITLILSMDKQIIYLETNVKPKSKDFIDIL